MDEVRIGIVGTGGMGSNHARKIEAGSVEGMRLAAVCDRVPSMLEPYSHLPRYSHSEELIHSGEVDAVLIATPHFDHTRVGIQALEAGLHVLVEKPISVHKADCERLIAAHRHEDQVFSAMFNHRTSPDFCKLRDLIRKGELGTIHRIVWIITTWFRPDAYYASGSWRATWAGEGGGVLMNQCPHQLDLFQWLFGMPRRVHAFCDIGRFHDIEVEDDVTAFMEYENGCRAVFITSTGEAPGCNRLEVSAERGKVTVEGGRIHFERNEVETTEFLRNSEERIAKPAVWKIEIPVAGSESGHVGILQNFANAIRFGEPLLAPAREGIHSVELANAMLLSSFAKSTIDLPMDAAVFEDKLNDLIASSRFQAS